jgi:hypothetical protein
LGTDGTRLPHSDPRWLGSVLKEISIPQRALLIGVRGEPLTRAEKAAWLEATHRAYQVGHEFQVVTVISGARGGKDSRFLAPSQIYEAVYGTYKVKSGETVTIACIAQDANAAHILLKLVVSYLNASPLPSRMVKKERRDAVELTNGVEIRVFPSLNRLKNDLRNAFYAPGSRVPTSTVLRRREFTGPSISPPIASLR